MSVLGLLKQNMSNQVLTVEILPVLAVSTVQNTNQKLPVPAVPQVTATPEVVVFTVPLTIGNIYAMFGPL